MNMDNSNDTLQQKTLQKLRNNAEEDRKKKIKIIVTHRELLLKELFTMTGEGNNINLDENDHVMSFLKGGDVTQIDQDKWSVFIDKNKISNVKLRQDSTSPSPANDDPLKKRKMAHPSVRMVTRGVSGAVRPKSVDEILSSLDQKDSPYSPLREKSLPIKQVFSSTLDRPSSNLNSTTSSQLPITITATNTYNGVKLSSIKNGDENGLDLYAWQLRASYFPLYKQLQTSRKTLTTHDWMLAREELRAVKTINKIEALKKKNVWSLRQLKQHKSAPRTKTHWDSLLDEMKWMKTDFKQERKWKMAMAYITSEAVMEWHSAVDKSTVCVKSHIPEPISLDELDLDTNDLAITKMDVDTENILNEDGAVDNVGDITAPNITADDENSGEVDELAPIKSDIMMGTAVKDDVMDDESPSMPTTPSLSNDIIQEYRTIVKDFDPNMPILTLSAEQFGDFNADSLFPDILTYAPPNPNFNDLYYSEIEYGRITPISKVVANQFLLTAPKHYNRKRRTLDKEEEEGNIKVLKGHERYDTRPLVSPIFSPKRIKDSNYQQPSIPSSAQQSTNSHWSEDDDVCLISFIIQYSFNWDLICDALNSVRLPVTSIKRTPFECHDRWKRNNLTSLTGQVSSAYTSKLKRELNRRPAMIKFDSPVKRQRQYSIFEAIKKTQKKREEMEKTSATTNAAIVPPRSTIEVHGTNSSGQRLPTAMEMSIHKAQRERQMAQAVLEQRQLSAAISLGGQQQQQKSAAAVNTALQQPRPPNSAVTNPIATAAPATAPSVPAPTSTSPTVRQSPQQQPLNRYPSAQLQLLRQQQMVLMAAAQQQAQQQAAAQAAQAAQQQQQTNVANRPNNTNIAATSVPVPATAASSTTAAKAGNIPSPATIQRFANAIQQQQQQAQQVQQVQQAQQQLQMQQAQQQLQLQQHAQLMAAQQAQQLAQVQAQQQQSSNEDNSVQQQNSQMVSSSPGLPQQQAKPSPQQQQQLAAQLNAAQANPLMFAAQLAQMGYPISQLPVNQQLQLQRYLAQLQIRNAAVAAATANVNNNAPVNNNNNTNNANLQTALLAQQQLQRLQQVQQAQQVLQMQQQQQQQQQSPQQPQQPPPSQ